MKNFQMRAGSVMGSGHLDQGINNQDAFVAKKMMIGNKEYLLGVVLDGCTGSADSHNEVGAILLADMIQREAPAIMKQANKISKFPEVLHKYCVDFLTRVLHSMVLGFGLEALIDFIEHFLLSTVLGFIMDGKETIVFSSGDGLFIRNDTLHTIDQQNRPLYMAFHLLPTEYRKMIRMGDLPERFTTWIFETKTVKRLAVFTDGFQGVLNCSSQERTQRINQIWSNNREFVGLQDQLIHWFSNGLFNDDCTVVAVQDVEAAMDYDEVLVTELTPQLTADGSE